MKALVKEKDGTMRIKQMDIPTIKQDEVLIQVKAVGICGSDLRLYRNKHIYYPPVVVGHEFSGIIKEVSPEISEWKQGDRVTVEPHALACGTCFHCKKGNIHICSSKRSLGWGVDGACAEFISVSKRLLHRLPNGITFEEGAVIEPTAIVTHALIERTNVSPGDFVVVLGAGSIGLLASMIAKSAGATVMLVGTEEDEALRLKVARDIGIDYAVNLNKTNVYNEVMMKTQNLGADVVVEASGAEAAANNAINIVRKHGRIAAIGESGEDTISLCWDKVVMKAVTIVGNFSSSPSSWDRAISLIHNKKIHIKPLITETLPLEQWEQAYLKVENKQAIKILLTP